MVTNRPAPRDLRASDSDRDRVITLLSEAAADGRLTSEEHSERVERAQSARTLGELAVLTTDLAAPGAQPIRLDGRRGVAGVFAKDSRDGRWVVPASLPVMAVFGEVELDFRDAILQNSRIIVYATVVAGTLHLIVPDGVIVETNGTSVLTRTIRGTFRQPGQGRYDVSPTAVPTVIEVRTMAFGGRIRVTSPKKPGWLGGLRRSGLPR
jgi:hypothetical protein